MYATAIPKEIIWISNIILTMTPILLGQQLCPLQLPCQCDEYRPIVNCARQQLTAVPTFTHFDRNWTIDLSGNEITDIPADAFSRINLQSLDLSSNKIKKISKNAFTGSEESLTELHLEYNELKGLPECIGKLHFLQTLSVQGNNMTNYSSDILRNISTTLTSFRMGDTTMTKWPNATSLLTNLTILEICHFSTSTLPDNCLQPFSRGLQSLSFIGTKLESIPQSLNTLKKLQKLSFDQNVNLSSTGIHPSAFQGLTNLQEIDFQDGNLTTLPPIFENLTNLQTLMVYSEPLESIGDDVFPATLNTSLNFIRIYGGNIRQIPKSISNVHSLTTLDFIMGSLEIIQTNDFYGLTKLLFLTLSGNPIKNISDDSFKNNPALVSLYLLNTDLQTVPRAAAHLPALQYLDMEGPPLECTCADLSWMKNLPKPPKFQVLGNCRNSKLSIESYVLKVVPQCPTIEMT